MENRSPGHCQYSTPILNPPEPRASNMYFLQVKPNNGEGSLEAEAIPLHMLINEQDSHNEQYLISVLQGKQLQLFIDSREQPSADPVTSQYFSLPLEPQITNTEIQTLNNENNLNTGEGHLAESEKEIDLKTSTLLSSATQDKISKSLSNSGQNKHVVQKFVHIQDRVVPPRAVAVLPSTLLLRRGAVAPRRPLPQRVRFGPVEGIKQNLSTDDLDNIIQESSSSGLPVFLLKTEDEATTHIDVTDKDKSNWLSLLPLGDQSTANVWLHQEDHELYGVTTQSIPARTPLVLGYSKEYVETHGLPVEQPVLDLDTVLASKHRQWWCHECHRSMSSAAQLQSHMDECHLDEKPKTRRYRCLHCTRTFSRIFTLRRHTARHCTKKQKEEKNNTQPANGVIDTSKPEDLPDIPLNTSADDSRLPSDESLQTLTNNLDFSTNLFDDRMPNLDISGSSRSDEFNPYSLGLRDDIGLGPSMDFGMDEPCKEVKAENTETVFVTCRYCNQSIVRGRQRQHVKVCSGRRFRCECGRVFQYKDKLALHIHLDHGNSETDRRKEKDTKDSVRLQYKCETCNHNFKRRGMLVNHLWRVHQHVGAAVPLEKLVRHYPCGACPKLYRTAAKRDRHVLTHHPGSAARGGAVEGGRVACSPAACAACPRQYATRAKLLQHVRQHHPTLAPPLKKKMSIKFK